MAQQPVSATQTPKLTDLDGDDLVTRVVSMVAERKGVDPLELEPRLFDAIDPDALTWLLDSSSPGTELAVEFSYAGYDVTIEAGEEQVIHLTPA